MKQMRKIYPEKMNAYIAHKVALRMKYVIID